MAEDAKIYEKVGSNTASIHTLDKDLTETKKLVNKVYHFLLLNVGISTATLIPGKNGGGASDLLALVKAFLTFS